MVDYLWNDQANEPKSMLDDLDWHGFQTLYEQNTCNGKKYIRIGDDYQHYMDEGRHYDEETLMYRIKKIADELMTAFNEATKNKYFKRIMP